MRQLPEKFLQQTRETIGSELFERYLKAFEEEPPVSIRLNRFSEDFVASDGDETAMAVEAEAVPWCRGGYYLPSRPTFTFDPLLHAGCYYVQEASSMFLDHVLRHLSSPQLGGLKGASFLDMCAAPGGKSTILLSNLPEGSTLVSNEPNPKRAQILSENLQKWQLSGLWPSKLKMKNEKLKVIVSNGFPKDIRKAKLTFDLILCDVPCSGEGMFRKDTDSIGEWSPENVEKCWRLQREIVADAWACLRDGGHLIYSTCTLNTKENEENIRWMMDEFDAEPVEIPIEADWRITGSLLPDFTASVYRFIPGLTRGEGLFMAILRKKGDGKSKKIDLSRTSLKIIPNDFLDDLQTAIAHDAPMVELNYEQAIQYLRREAIVLPSETPRGTVVVSHQNHPLGLAKNIGTRANNLYPKEWRIKSTYLPENQVKVINTQHSTPITYETIFRHP